MLRSALCSASHSQGCDSRRSHTGTSTPPPGEEGIAPVPTLRSNKMMFENNHHAYQRGQEDQNKILADHFMHMHIYFLSIGVVVARFLRPEHLGQHHRRCPPRPRNCDHNAHHSDTAIARSHCGRCQYSLYANGLRALFPGSPRPGVAIRGRKMGKPASDGSADHDPKSIENAPPNGALGALWEA